MLSSSKSQPMCGDVVRDGAEARRDGTSREPIATARRRRPGVVGGSYVPCGS